MFPNWREAADPVRMLVASSGPYRLMLLSRLPSAQRSRGRAGGAAFSSSAARNAIGLDPFAVGYRLLGGYIGVRQDRNGGRERYDDRCSATGRRAPSAAGNNRANAQIVRANRWPKTLNALKYLLDSVGFPCTILREFVFKLRQIDLRLREEPYDINLHGCSACLCLTSEKFASKYALAVWSKAGRDAQNPGRCKRMRNVVIPRVAACLVLGHFNSG
ncbi:hypothetical protein SAMN05216338_1006201 [Bradyrhizobium sp. Rc2d]|nr:hypothetical protein SAMN05216338_1006201 [Bradyrhizobium sp. Rc2d]